MNEMPAPPSADEDSHREADLLTAPVQLDLELARAVWAVIEPHTPDGDDDTEGREFVDFVTRIGFGVHATVIVSRGGLRWQPARVYHDGLRVRLDADPSIDLIAELDGQLAALFPLAALGARSRPSALSSSVSIAIASSLALDTA